MYATVMLYCAQDIMTGYVGNFAWDVLTASYVLWPDIFSCRDVEISVVVGGESDGQTRRAESGKHVVSVLFTVDTGEWERRIVSALCER